MQPLGYWVGQTEGLDLLIYQIKLGQCEMGSESCQHLDASCQQGCWICHNWMSVNEKPVTVEQESRIFIECNSQFHLLHVSEKSCRSHMIVT